MKATILGACLLLLSGCGLSSEGTFTSGLSRDRCDDTYPICSQTAGCVLGAGKYLEGSFPGTRQFIVTAPEESVITVSLFFRSQVAVGVDTGITWHEPGCFDSYEYRSGGEDIFLEAGGSRVMSRSQQVFLDGDHLIEVFSDAIADYVLKVEVDAATK